MAPDLVTLSLLKAPTTCMNVLADKLNSKDTIVDDPQSYDRSDLTNALNRMRYDIMTVKNAWDLKSIWNDSFAPVISSIQIMEVIRDCIDLMKQKNSKKGVDIVLEFPNESFHKVMSLGDFERINIIVCNVLQMTID